ncbi:MAG: lactate racemase domain-containing protein [Candidatus Aegiribacteria sp.]
MEGDILIPPSLRDVEVETGLRPRPLSGTDMEKAWSGVMSDLERFARAGVVTLVVNDATRPPSYPMLEPLREVLDGKVRVLFATGTHRPVTSRERDHLLGGCFAGAPWKSNDCDSRDMACIGETYRGTQVKVDPWMLDGHPVLSVNSVEPHYFAGFTGGRKSFLPGVSARETVVANHYLACLPGSRPGELEGNPVHEDMDEALSMLEERVEIIQGNGVMHHGRLVDFFAGSCRDSFERAAAESVRLSELPVRRRCRLLVLHPGAPLHVSLYQSEKALYNCSHIVEDGGIILLVSPCPEGLGADHMEQAFISSMDERWTAPRRDGYRIGDHAIVRLKEMRKRMTIALASHLPDELVSRMGIQPVEDLTEWIRDHWTGQTLFIPRAGFVVPRLESG